MQNSEMFIGAPCRIGARRAPCGSAFAVASRCTDFGRRERRRPGASAPRRSTRSPSFTPDPSAARSPSMPTTSTMRISAFLSALATKTNGPLLAALDRDRRDHHGLRPDVEIDLDIDIHAGPQLRGSRWQRSPWPRWCRRRIRRSCRRNRAVRSRAPRSIPARRRARPPAALARRPCEAPRDRARQA